MSVRRTRSIAGLPTSRFRRVAAAAVLVLLAGTGMVPGIAISPAAAVTCGTERWSVKTGTDADASKVQLSSITPQMVPKLRSLPAPPSLPADNRISPTETTVYQLTATLMQYKLEDDSDYHLVLDAGGGQTMIVEIPDPSCVGSGSPLLPGIQTARQQFDSHFTATTSFKTANTTVTVRGVGFFDFQHGQTGVAPNAIELHPLLDFAVGDKAAAITSPTGRTTVNACPADRVQPAGFSDVSPDDVHNTSIDCAVFWGVANGTTATTYNPSGDVARDQMASFIARVIRNSGGTLPSNPPDAFSDDNGDAHEPDINALAAVGIVGGTGGGNFNPTGTVSRAQMASFIEHAYAYETGVGLPSNVDFFADDNGDTHEADINSIASAGIAGGRADGTYGPTGTVARDQMATFVVRTLDVLVANGYSTPPSAAPPPRPPPPPNPTCSATASPTNPPRFSTVHILVSSNLPSTSVTATAHYKTTDTTNNGATDSSGDADIPFNISGATSGFTVVVDVNVGTQAACQTSFTPQ